MEKIYFTPGPTELHPVAKAALKTAIDSGVGSISHRSKDYESIQRNCEIQVRTLLNVPKGYQIFFLSSGTEAWERVIQNAVGKTSYHLINGSFSKRFYETSLELKKEAKHITKALGLGFDISDLPPEIDAELICTTLNETSTGVSLPQGFLGQLRQRYPTCLLAVDAVSTAPYPALDLNLVDYYFFSVQKFFGLPAGLAVLIVSPTGMAKAKKLQSEGCCIGAHHSLLSLEKFAAKFQTPSTPNVIGIYTLACVCEHFNNKGVEQLLKETEQKAEIIYSCLGASKVLSPFVSERRFQSQTVVSAVCLHISVEKVLQSLAAEGMELGQGYGELKTSQFRIANFASHSLDSTRRLAEVLSRLS